MAKSAGTLLFYILGVLAVLAGAAACSGNAGSPVPDVIDAGAVVDSGGSDASVGPSFNVSSAAPSRTTRLTVTFDAPPNAAQAVVLANYSVDGLTLSGAPSLSGSVVTLTTSVQSARAYNLTIANITRATDGRALAQSSVAFEGRPAFEFSVASTNAVSAVVHFSAPPNATQALDLTTFAIAGLTLSGADFVTDTDVRLTTSRQTAQPYTLAIGDVTRASDGEPLVVDTATFTGTESFNVANAASIANRTITVTFDAPPRAAEATTLANYSVPNLVLSGTPTLLDNVVTITTSAQADADYEVTVANVVRADDERALSQTTATFHGRGAFNVQNAEAISATSLRVVFDAPPNAVQAADAAHYAVPGLTLTNPQAVGNTVTLTTTVQQARSYHVTVSEVTRAADGEALATTGLDFTGRAPFSIADAHSPGPVTLTVRFDAAPNAAAATTLASYSVPGLVLSGVPSLVGNAVRITTSAQLDQSYTLTVTGVTRAADGEPLVASSASFDGTPVKLPTITDVVVSATSPDNGAVPFNTGSSTVVLTGTDLATVNCAGATKGVKLDDLDGAGDPRATTATTCVVDSDTQITATFPAGIQTAGSRGWNVIATNDAGSNATSAVRFVPIAGLLITEVYAGTTGATTDEFIELYNATSLPINPSAISGFALRLHVRAESGDDTNKSLTVTPTSVMPAHGYFLIVSSVATTASWYDKRDGVFSAALGGNTGVYISLSATEQARVLDKVGFGDQPAGGYEGKPSPTLANDVSIQRKRASGHAVDTDSNADDFAAASVNVTPKGTVDPPES